MARKNSWGTMDKDDSTSTVCLQWNELNGKTMNKKQKEYFIRWNNNIVLNFYRTFEDVVRARAERKQ